MYFEKGQVWDCYTFAQKMRGNNNPNMSIARAESQIFRDDIPA